MFSVLNFSSGGLFFSLSWLHYCSWAYASNPWLLIQRGLLVVLPTWWPERRSLISIITVPGERFAAMWLIYSRAIRHQEKYDFDVE